MEGLEWVATGGSFVKTARARAAGFSAGRPGGSKSEDGIHLFWHFGQKWVPR